MYLLFARQAAGRVEVVMVDLGPDDTVLCTATMGFGRLRDFAEAAGKAGFSAISLSGGDYASARKDGMSDLDIRTLLAANGLRIAELDGVVDWLAPLPRAQGAGYDLDIPFFGHTQDTFFAIADALGARSITAVDPFLRSAPVEEMAEAFARLCDRAAEHGLLVHLEFLSWGPVPDLVTAWDIVHMADRANGGIMLDVLYLMRSGGPAMLAQVPGERIFATQLCDGLLVRQGDCFADAADRDWPGQGEFGVADLLRDLRNSGCLAPLGLEVMGQITAGLSPEAIAQKGFLSLQAVRSSAK